MARTKGRRPTDRPATIHALLAQLGGSDALLDKWLADHQHMLAQLAYDWPFWRRADQAPPPGDWRCWMRFRPAGPLALIALPA